MLDKSINASGAVLKAVSDMQIFGFGCVLVSDSGVEYIDPDYLYNTAPASGINPTHGLETNY